MNDELNTAGVGHNNPPPYNVETVAGYQARTDQLNTAAQAWLDLGEIETEEQAQKGNDFVEQLRKHFNAMEDARKTDKKPWDDKATEVHQRYKRMLDPVEAMAKKVKPRLAAFVTKQRAKAEAEAAERRRVAEATRREAEQAAVSAAARNDVAAETEAQAQLKAANKEEKQAARPVKVNLSSATGGGRTMSLRKTYKAQIAPGADARRAFGWIMDDPDLATQLRAEMERLCTAARRKADGPTTIPGVTWDEIEGIA